MSQHPHQIQVQALTQHLHRSEVTCWGVLVEQDSAPHV